MPGAVITVCGETVVDLVPQADGDFRALPGGSPANVAVALARLGEPTTFLARLAGDVFGRRMRAHLESNGVDPRDLVAAPEPSSLAVVSLDADGRATYDFWLAGAADWQWSPAELQAHPARDCRALHAGSIASWTPPGAAAVSDLLRGASTGGSCTVTFDPNVRPALMGQRLDARAAIEELVSSTHAVKASDEDLDWLYPGCDVVQVARTWSGLGPGLVVVTRGSEGALVVRAGSASVIRRPAPRVTVVDTVGAGDTFTAGLLHGLARLDALGADPVARLARLTDEDVAAVLDLASRAAAITCTREGCDPPTAAELDRPDLP